MSQDAEWGTDMPAGPGPEDAVGNDEPYASGNADPDEDATGPAGDREQSWLGGESETTSSFSLFEGDEGTLEGDVRRALVVLLKQRFITARTHPREWRALVGAQRLVRAQLNNLFLDLHLDTAREVAWKRQVPPEGGGRAFPTLLYDTAWGREDTILLVYLRSKFRHDLAGGADRVYVDRQDMLDHVAELRPPSATDRLADTRRAERAVETLYKAGLLIGPATGDRFEVCVAIEALVPLENLKQLLTWLKEQNRNSAPDDADDDGADGNGPEGWPIADEAPAMALEEES